ncbi:MAG: hypothetical protein WBE44_18025 [Terriglobales bacterium]|jgi:hypothetical protein
MELERVEAWIQLVIWIFAGMAGALKLIKGWTKGGLLQSMNLPQKGIYILLVIGLAISSVSLYFNYRPRIVEKIAEKPVEKVDTQPAPPATYKVDNPTGSIVNQDSANFGEQTVNNVPPSREMSPAKQSKFTDILRKDIGKLIVIEAGSTDDIVPLAYQLCDSAHNAGWGSVCPASQESISLDARLLTAVGIQCYSSDWTTPAPKRFRKAADAVKLGCEYQDHDYTPLSDRGIHFLTGGPISVGVTIVVGRPGRR